MRRRVLTAALDAVRAQAAAKVPRVSTWMRFSGTAGTPLTQTRGQCFGLLPALMHPRPLYRWKSLWLGVVFFAFLGWASWNYIDVSPSLNVTAFGQGWGLGRVGQHTCLVKYSGVVDFGWLVEESQSTYEKRARYWTLLGLNHWAISDLAAGLSLFVAWLGWLAWRWRRWRGSQTVTPT